MNIDNIFSEQFSFMVKPLISEVFSSENLCELGLKTPEQIILSEGDFIKVFGKKITTVCKIKKIKYDSKENVIYLPLRIRRKLETQSNKFIRIQAFPYKFAELVKMTPVEFDFQPTQKIISHIKKKLKGEALIKKDIVSVPIGFLRYIDCEVLDVQPTSPAQIARGTTIIIVKSYIEEKKIKEEIILTLTI